MNVQFRSGAEPASPVGVKTAIAVDGYSQSHYQSHCQSHYGLSALSLERNPENTNGTALGF